MSVEDKLAQVRDWLVRKNYRETADAHVPEWMAAEALSVSLSALRRMRDYGNTCLVFRAMGGGAQRKRWQVNVPSLALFLHQQDQQDH